MKEEDFKEKAINTKGLLLLMYNNDLVLDKNLEFRMSERKKKDIPHLKLGEIVVLESINLDRKIGNTTMKDQIVKDAILNVHAQLDELECTPITIKKNDKLIKEEITRMQEYMVMYLINTLTEIQIKQFYYKLGIKNAEQLIDGTSTVPIY